MLWPGGEPLQKKSGAYIIAALTSDDFQTLLYDCAVRFRVIKSPHV
jgi:hypothetical protein